MVARPTPQRGAHQSSEDRNTNAARRSRQKKSKAAAKSSQGLLFSEAIKPCAEAAGHGRRGWCATVTSTASICRYTLPAANTVGSGLAGLLVVAAYTIRGSLSGLGETEGWC